MKKRGQFYLLGAIVIIVLIAGFAGVSNYVLRKSSVRIYDVKDELGIESGKVLEHGVYGGDKTVDFISKYEEYAGEDREIYFIFGNENLIKIVTYDEFITGEITIGFEGTDVGTSIIDNTATTTEIVPSGKDIKVTINEITYDFEIKPGQNFFFIIQQDVEGETHVAKS